ncbi:MAG: SAM-dependent chlorinase/fluorinase [Rhodospirillaceae bacterium]|nr:SAM-dependent chlorinase/fluorinase [Rhodospirillaceae bacterium]
MIFLYTDFGREGPYMGQMEAVLRRAADVPVITLLADAPAFDVRGNAYLLAAYTRDVQPDDVVLCIVDPGVGTERHALVMRADGRWFVGPDNGLMSIVARRAARCDLWRITWRPENLSASFHGRDLFAPIAALLAKAGLNAAGDKLLSVNAEAIQRPAYTDQYAAIITFDRYGNAITGLDVSTVDPRAMITCAGHLISPAATFGAVPEGQVFWYGNSSGLVEIAVNQGNARQLLNLQAGMALRIEPKAMP